jgi:1,4-dihydroxy-6-naphthoate synthase
MKLRLGFSSCPNDVFAFYGILERKVDLRGLEFDIQILDVQELNEKLAAGELDFSKASFHAALHLADRYGVLPSGSALGFGVGPLLLAAREGTLPAPESRVVCPGAWTTATLLFRGLYPEATGIRHCLFSEIMPALRRDDADFGVVIHEGRFTYREEGLALVRDLGAAWEELTGGPVPLGGILGRLSLPPEVLSTFNTVLRDSILYALEHRQETFPLMQRYAQELDPAVIWAHVDLYVNEQTVDLGDTGCAALAAMTRVAGDAGLLPDGTPPLRLL